MENTNTQAATQQDVRFITRQNEAEIRPWGSFEVLYRGASSYWVKHISVLPGARLSLQKHNHRNETWVCVEGEVTAEIDGKEVPMKYGDMVTFPVGTVHRLSSVIGGVIIEIAHGDDVREDDIERLQDDYGRNA